VLDTRQYRSSSGVSEPEPRRRNVVTDENCPQRLDPALTMLGREQEQWLHEALGRSGTRWNVIAQQTYLSPVDRQVGPGEAWWTDGWDGYPARARAAARVIRDPARSRTRSSSAGTCTPRRWRHPRECRRT
jgi:alkaline phosphatase D